MLWPRHERFLREFIKTGNQTEAWMRVHPHMKGRRVAEAAASRAMSYPYMRARYEQLMERHMKKADISIEKILTDYQDALDMAKEQGKAGEIVSAATAQAKLVGLLRDRVEAGQVGDFDNIADISTILEMVAKESGQETANALARAFNLTSVAPSLETEVALVQAKPASDAVN